MDGSDYVVLLRARDSLEGNGGSLTDLDRVLLILINEAIYKWANGDDD